MHQKYIIYCCTPRTTLSWLSAAAVDSSAVHLGELWAYLCQGNASFGLILIQDCLGKEKKPRVCPDLHCAAHLGVCVPLCLPVPIAGCTAHRINSPLKSGAGSPLSRTSNHFHSKTHVIRKWKEAGNVKIINANTKMSFFFFPWH